MFGSMERLEEGKKVRGKNHFPLFGTLSERKERGKKEELRWAPYSKNFPSNYEQKVGNDDVM
jgi:hypothetical protein